MHGTGVALGFAAIALVLTGAWLAGRGWGVAVPLPVVVALLAAAAAAERIALQLGPRSWYTASTPTIILAGLLGGPALGAAAGLATQTFRTDVVWRRRLAEGGLGSLQGFAAGVIGLVGLTGPFVSLEVALALAAALAINSAGRLLILLERQRRPILRAWVDGIAVDVIEGAVALPLLSVILISYGSSPTLALGSVASMLAALLLAQRLRELHLAELAAEQVNARRDQLTGAPNRRAFAEAIEMEQQRVLRGGHPAGLFVVDLDHFKSVNDRFGHSVGDDVLQQVVRRLSEGLRGTDLVARWGGEELTVLAPGVGSRRMLEEYAERIRRLVADSAVPTRAEMLPVTVSVGGTRLDGSLTPEAALARADLALYDAKRTRDASVVVLPQSELQLVTA